MDRHEERHGEGCFAVKVVTRAGAERVARFACELARQRRARGHPGKVSCVTKSETALTLVYRDGKALTADQGGAATTAQMAAAVLAVYRNR